MSMCSYVNYYGFTLVQFKMVIIPVQHNTVALMFISPKHVADC